jgi:hypothetical protein
MTGQTMISAAFFVMLTMAVLTANRMIIESNKDYIEAQAVEQATNFANALLTEILTKKFDSRVTLDAQGKVSGPYIVWLDSSLNVIGPYGGSVPAGKCGPPWPTTPTLFDGPSIMGTSPATKNYVMPGGAPDVAPYKSIRGDSPSYLDDVDDYHGYERIANASDISGYDLKVSVYYVKKSSPDAASSTQTYYKRIDVTVEHPLYLPRKLSFSAIATY